MDWHLLAAYWSKAELITNGILLLHLLGATAVGCVLGYERSYHGRAAGMRTYALVCIASTMLTVINGYPSHWYGGLAATPATADPTRVIQGIMTGIGFLCAGVIMKEGFTIRGLSTSASIWATAAIGIVIGVGFYGAAISATFVTAAIMTGFGKLEKRLPHQTMHHLTLVYPADTVPGMAHIRDRMRKHGFDVVDCTYHRCQNSGQFNYGLVLVAVGAGRSEELVDDLSTGNGIVEFRLSPTHS